MRNPITPKEMYNIIPRDLQHSEYMDVLATNYFGREGSQHRLWTLRNQPDEAIRMFRNNKAERTNRTGKKTLQDTKYRKCRSTCDRPKTTTTTTTAIRNRLQTNFPDVYIRPGEGYGGGLQTTARTTIRTTVMETTIIPTTLSVRPLTLKSASEYRPNVIRTKNLPLKTRK